MLGACMFNAIFWQEKLGLNLLFYDTFLVGSIFFFYPDAKNNKAVRWLFLLQSICIVMVIVHNTLLSKIALVLVLLTFTAFAQYAHRSVFFAGGSILLNAVLVWETLSNELKNRQRRSKKKPLIRWMLRLVVPVLIAGVFFLLYASSNPVFSNIADSIGQRIGQFFDLLFGWFSPGRLFFLALGFYLTAWILLRSARNYFSNEEALYKDPLERFPMGFRFRKKQTTVYAQAPLQKPRKKMLALKNTNTSGVLSLTLLNILLLAVNLIDIVYVWFNLGSNKDVNLSDAVHEGTGQLIFSILLAMTILLFFFHGSLNFYKKNKWLKYLAYAWIVQNCVLVISVVIRDYYYITRFGLAYKRIGVLFFLLSVLAGLVTVFIKILHKKTSYYLFRINAWVNISLLVLASLVNWDATIARYNLQHAGTTEVDWEFLLTLSGSALPVLDQNIHLLDSAKPPVTTDSSGNQPNREAYINVLHRNESSFLAEQKEYSWLSWNYSDSYVKKYLSQHPKQTLSDK